MNFSDQLQIAQIRVYPIKSLDGCDLPIAKITKGGALQFDRMFALKNSDGDIINAKKYPSIQKIRTNFDLESMNMQISLGDLENNFNLVEDVHVIADWFSDYFSEKILLHRNDNIGFPDDPKRPGPTVCSLESIREVCKWFPGLDEEEVRRRFRTNIELTRGQSPFWEDFLLCSEVTPGNFQLGEVHFEAVKPCPRCPVPSRNSRNAEPLKGFQKTFSERRKSGLSGNIDKGHFPHYYMFAINTRVLSGYGDSISTGNKVNPAPF
jgi:hypothetical protein